jgi:hypothetical protein
MNEHTQPLKPLGAALEPAASGFDIAQKVVDGRQMQWSREQFQRLPLLDRVRLLADGELRFFRKGTEVSAREALRDL